MPVVTNRGVRVHWEQQGSGTPLLLVMGHRFSSRLWWPVLPALAARHHVVTFDNRGTGLSDAPRRLTVDDLVGDAFAVLDAAGVEAAHVFGVSMGGGIALEMAMQQPGRVRSLVLGCSGIKTTVRPPMPLKRQAMYHLPRRLVVPLSRRALYGEACSPDAVAKDMAALLADRSDRWGVLAQARATAGYTTTVEQVAAITAPTLVLHGTADPVAPYVAGQQLAATIPGARLVTYEGARHNFIVDTAEQTTAEVLSFFSDVDSKVAAR